MGENKMAYILKDEIKINKPIIFLCGPYYNDLDKSDRRKILQDFLLENFPKKCLPLIIDDFLTKENIGDNEISIQLLEEIIYVFLTIFLYLLKCPQSLIL